MRRVMALIGFSSFFVSLFCLYFKFSIILFVIALVCLLLVLCIKKLRLSILIVLLCTIMLSCVNCYVTDKKIENYEKIYCNGAITLKGELLDYPEVSDSGFNYTFKTVDENRVKFRIMSNEMFDIEPGDVISGSFNFNSDYAKPEDKVYFSTYTYTTQGIEIENKNEFNIAKLRKILKRGIDENTTYARGLTKAILFSDKSGLTDEVYINLQRCGLLHATATSGLHLTIVTGFVFALLSFLGISKRKSSIFAIGFIILFMIVIGFRFSLMRAGIMMILYFSAGLFNRENDAFNSIGLSIAFLVFQNPYTVVSCSFLLSASATIGMFVMFKALYQKVNSLNFKSFGSYKKIIVALSASVLQSVSAIIFTLPVTYIYFGYFSIAGIVANAILSVFISIILIFGLLLCLTAFLPIIPVVLGAVLDVAGLVVLRVTAFISKFKYCLINIDSTYTAVAIFFVLFVTSVAILVYYFSNFDKKRSVRLATILCVDIVLVCVLLMVAFPSKTANVRIQNSSGGICVSVVKDGKMIAVDTGGKKALKRIRYEVTRYCLDEIDTLVVKDDNKSYNSVKRIANEYKTNNVLLDKTKFKEFDQVSAKFSDISNGGCAKIDGFEFEIIKQQTSNVFYLTNSQVSVLIIDRNTDCLALPDFAKTCDIVVISDSLPNNVDEIKANEAIVCDYDYETQAEMSKYCPTYSLVSQSLEIEMGKKLKVKAV